ncbi:hypothetical protein ACF0H5_023888 [Mactra antiquata]
MTSYLNVTTTDSDNKTVSSLLWLPYVIITVVCLAGLIANFCCYHRKRRLKYLRKVEVMETRERVIERRMVLNLIKAKYRTCLIDEESWDRNRTNVMTLGPQQIRNSTSDSGIAHL